MLNNTPPPSNTKNNNLVQELERRLQSAETNKLIGSDLYNRALRTVIEKIKTGQYESLVNGIPSYDLARDLRTLGCYDLAEQVMRNF